MATSRLSKAGTAEAARITTDQFDGEPFEMVVRGTDGSVSTSVIEADVAKALHALMVRDGLTLQEALNHSVREAHRIVPVRVTAEVPRLLLALLEKAHLVARGKPLDITEWIVEQMMGQTDALLQFTLDDEAIDERGSIDRTLGVALGAPLGGASFEDFVEGVAVGDPESCATAERVLAVELAPEWYA